LPVGHSGGIDCGAGAAVAAERAVGAGGDAAPVRGVRCGAGIRLRSERARGRRRALPGGPARAPRDLRRGRGARLDWLRQQSQAQRVFQKDWRIEDHRGEIRRATVTDCYCATKRPAAALLLSTAGRHRAYTTANAHAKSDTTAEV